MKAKCSIGWNEGADMWNGVIGKILLEKMHLLICFHE